ncbi:MAG: acylphosphatase [Sphingomonadaceae bacterium]
MTSEPARRLRVHGRVQGVFFRNWTRDHARELGLKGWVRNREDGTVEIYATGAQGGLDRLIELVRSGPPAAQVDRLEIEEAESEELEGFEKRPTV